TTAVVPRQLAADQVHGQDVRGNPIPAKRLRKLLQQEVPVLVSADGKAVYPLHLRVHKDDVIVLVGPAQMPPQGSTTPPVLATPATDYYPPVDAPRKSGPPELKLEIRGPRETLIGAESLYVIAVTNAGNGTVARASVFVKLPENMAAMADGLEAN